jgi:hypothetical protein
MDDCVTRRPLPRPPQDFEREQIAGLAIEYLTESGVPDRMAFAPPVFDTAPRTRVVPVLRTDFLMG